MLKDKEQNAKLKQDELVKKKKKEADDATRKKKD